MKIVSLPMFVALALAAGAGPLAAQTNGVSPNLGSVLAPAPPAELGRGPARPYTSPVTPTEPVPPTNPGPVTGYGPGGMQQEPGTAVNPPYLQRGEAPPPGH